MQSGRDYNVMRFLIIFFAIAVLAVPIGYKRLTKGFRIEKMKIALPFHPEWDAKEEHIGQAREILAQPFHYLDRGSQCYVFASEDDKYVIKLFRFDQKKHLLRAKIGKLFRSKKEETEFEAKVDRLLSASKLAYDRVPFETGLVYIHLNTGSQGLPVLNCKDALGRKYRLPLDEYRFVLQKKAKPLREELIRHLQNPEEMKHSLDSIFSLLITRTSKGIHNSDSNLNRNIGFLDGRAIDIDFGNFCDCLFLDQPSRRMLEISRFSLPLRAWILQQAPEWVAYFDEKMERVKMEVLYK